VNIATKIFALRNLPLFLALVPFLVWALNALARLSAFDWLRGISDSLSIFFFVGPVLFWNWMGLIPFNILGGTSTLWGFTWLPDLIYALSSSIILYIAGKLVLLLF
jgi:hypothetical protein